MQFKKANWEEWEHDYSVAKMAFGIQLTIAEKAKISGFGRWEISHSYSNKASRRARQWLKQTPNMRSTGTC